MSSFQRAMKAIIRRGLSMTATAIVVTVGGLGAGPASAVDSEVFFTRPVDDFAQPNVLFILDTSQSMFGIDQSAPVGAYVPGTTYPGACDPDKYYWVTRTGAVDCLRTDRNGQPAFDPLEASQFDCPTKRAIADNVGRVDFDGYVAQLRGSQWRDITQASLLTACRNDTTQMGIRWLDRFGNATFNYGSYSFYRGNFLNWQTSGARGDRLRIDVVREAVARLVLSTEGINVGLMRFGYDGDVVFETEPVDLSSPPLCKVLENPVEGSRSSNGAPVVFPVSSLSGPPVPGFAGTNGGVATDVREQLLYQLGAYQDPLDDDSVKVFDNLVDMEAEVQPRQIVLNGPSPQTKCAIPLFVPGGRSPIGAAMNEASLYFGGKAWTLPHGRQAALGSGYGYPSVWQARQDCTDASCSNDFYKSPILDDCAKNFIILLSDGTTEQDNEIDGPIQRRTGISCDSDPYLDVNGQPPPSQCVDDIAEWMASHDVITYEERIQADSRNTVKTYTIGFKLGTDAAANSARQLLQETATRGEGQFFEAQSATDLEGILSGIIRDILTDNTSFTSPAVSVNAFNRTQNLNDLYVSLFRPEFAYRWRGNLKKYSIDPVSGEIEDANGDVAVDTDGFFIDTVDVNNNPVKAQSYWSLDPDGADITQGGAASLLEWDRRRIYSNLASNNLAGVGNSLNSIMSWDPATAKVRLGIPEAATLDPDVLIEWVYGKDVLDADGDTVVDESRGDMGDPLHSRPVTVIYGGTASNPDVNDAAIFVLTNDGFMHSLDPGSGAENWAFVPANVLNRMYALYRNERTDPEDREYGLDGTIRVVRIDNNNNGVIEPEDEDGKRDRVYLYFGQRRGGPAYYGIDVTYKNSPRVMWILPSGSLAGMGQSWSTPTPARVRIETATRNVLVFGGGYSPLTEDQQPYSTDPVGNGIYMVDAVSGALLWRAGSTGSGANLELARMTNAIPADVRVIDISGDGLADRMYAGDLGGQLWRFDIINGQPAASLVEGGVLASVGNAGNPTGPEENTRRFFYAPDPALVTLAGTVFINIGIGSGHRELPVSDMVTQDAFFSIRDYNVFGTVDSDAYRADCTAAVGPCVQTVTESDLVDLTGTVGQNNIAAVPVGSPGWWFDLPDAGEKILAESRTFESKLFFTSYSPQERGPSASGCAIAIGKNVLYVISALDASSIIDLNNDGVVDEDDASRELGQRYTIAPEVVFIFPSPENPTTCIGQECRPEPICLVGLETCGRGFNNRPVRTFWQQRGVD